MVKVSNRNSIITVGIISGLIFGSLLGLILISIIYSFFNEMTQLIIYLSITCIFSIIIGYYMTLSLLRSHEKEFIIKEQSLFYKDHRHDFRIDKLNIYSIVYRPLSFGYELTFYLNDESVKTIEISRVSPIKKLEKELKLPINALGSTKKQKLSLSIKSTKESFKLFIKKEWSKILGSILGIIITVTSIILFVQYKDIDYIKMMLIAVSIGYGIFQFYNVYFKFQNEDILAKLILSIVASLAFIAIVFVVITLLAILLLKMPYTNDFIYYSIFLLPSFVIVVALIILVIVGLSYA